jgi:hypothetical protein
MKSNALQQCIPWQAGVLAVLQVRPYPHFPAGSLKTTQSIDNKKNL